MTDRCIYVTLLVYLQKNYNNSIMAVVRTSFENNNEITDVEETTILEELKTINITLAPTPAKRPRTEQQDGAAVISLTDFLKRRHSETRHLMVEVIYIFVYL